MRSVRSFVLRQGRLTPGQQRAINAYSAQWLLASEPTEKLNFPAIFGNNNPVVMEIGFGDGQCLLQMAQAMPEKNFIGIEVHRPGVGRLLQGIAEKQLTNVRVMNTDAVEVLVHQIINASLAGVHIFFSDPWHKKKHHKRRLIQPDFVRVLTQKLMPGGIIHLATDWQNYAEQMLMVLSENAELKNQSRAEDGFYHEPTLRPLTKFELRGVKLGHGVWDLIFKKGL